MAPFRDNYISYNEDRKIFIKEFVKMLNTREKRLESFKKGIDVAIDFVTKDRRPNLDKDITDLLVRLRDPNLSVDEQRVLGENIKILFDAKRSRKSYLPSSDSLVVVGGQLLGIVAILKYEELNVITTKALSFIPRGRV